MGLTQKYIGHGIGLRTTHFDELLTTSSKYWGVDWFEAISENFMVRGGRPNAVLEKLRCDVPIVLHGVSLSIGSSDGLNQDYLKTLNELVTRIEPAWISDHLCWGSAHGHYAHDLLPLPYTEEALQHVIDRVQSVQDFLGRQILLENVSSYVTFKSSCMNEWEFISQVAERADCGILLDVNNVFVSAFNHGFDGRDYIEGLPTDRIGQIHLAGHSVRDLMLVDTHDAPVPDGVWDLYKLAAKRFGRISSLVEWDDAIPPLAEVVAQSQRARHIEEQL